MTDRDFPHVWLFCGNPCQRFDASCTCNTPPPLSEINKYLVRARNQQAIVARVTKTLLEGGGFKKNGSKPLLERRRGESLFRALTGVTDTILGGIQYDVYEALKRHNMFVLCEMQGHEFTDVVALLIGMMPDDIYHDNIGPYPTDKAFDTAVDVATRHLLECIPMTRRLETAIADVKDVMRDLELGQNPDQELDYGEDNDQMIDALYKLFSEIDKAPPLSAIRALYVKECIAGDTK